MKPQARIESNEVFLRSLNQRLGTQNSELTAKVREQSKKIAELESKIKNIYDIIR
jgi:ribosomal protein S24E